MECTQPLARGSQTRTKPPASAVVRVRPSAPCAVGMKIRLIWRLFLGSTRARALSQRTQSECARGGAGNPLDGAAEAAGAHNADGHDCVGVALEGGELLPSSAVPQAHAAVAAAAVDEARAEVSAPPDTPRRAGAPQSECPHPADAIMSATGEKPMSRTVPSCPLNTSPDASLSRAAAPPPRRRRSRRTVWSFEPVASSDPDTDHAAQNTDPWWQSALSRSGRPERSPPIAKTRSARLLVPTARNSPVGEKASALRRAAAEAWMAQGRS